MGIMNGDDIDFNGKETLCRLDYNLTPAEDLMQVNLDWKEGLLFTASAPDSDFKLQLTPEDDASREGLTPMETMAIALGGCTGIDVISILQKKKQAVTNLQIKVTTRRVEEHPRVWTHALIEYFVTGTDIRVDGGFLSQTI